MHCTTDKFMHSEKSCRRRTNLVRTPRYKTTFLQVSADAAAETRYKGRQFKARSEYPITPVSNILFPHAFSEREKTILTSVPTFITIVPNRGNVVPYSVDETSVKKLKKIKKVMKRSDTQKIPNHRLSRPTSCNERPIQRRQGVKSTTPRQGDTK